MIYISFLIFFCILLYLIHNELAILQTQFYELKRYFSYKKNNRILKKYNLIFITLILINILILIYFEYQFLLCLFPILLIFLFKEEHYEKIVRFKYTSRVKRIYIISIIFTLLLGIITIYLSIKYHYLILPIFELFLVSSLKLYVALIMIIDYLLEYLINNKYKRKALKKIKRIKPILIGITGSYGKTSFKNFLYQLLSLKYRVCKTPKSYNTYLGIIKSVNEELSDNHEIMIIELGADKLGSLDKTLKLINFDYSVITSIGPQHLKTFKTIDNIVKEKSKIFDKTSKCVFINYNYEYLRILDKSKYNNSVTYSYYGDCDMYVNDIKIDKDNTQFTLNVGSDKYNLNTNILGEQQIENLLGSIVIALHLGIDIKEIQKKIQYLENEPHRMQIRYDQNIKIIDDSYNSNIKGFKGAVDILNLQTNYRIIITPGVIELGESWERENRKLGEYIANKLDYVILVGKSVTRPLYLGLINKGFDESNILIVDTFKEGYEFAKSLNKDITLLIENDLPDYYLK